MDDITLDEIDDLEGNLMDDLLTNEIRSTVQPERVTTMLFILVQYSSKFQSNKIFLMIL